MRNTRGSRRKKSACADVRLTVTPLNTESKTSVTTPPADIRVRNVWTSDADRNVMM